jgi:hypothetical protein
MSLARIGSRAVVVGLGVLASLALMAAPSWAASTPCTGPLGAVEIKGDISAGDGCDLSGTTVRGNVTVDPGGSLSTQVGSTTVITGNVESSKATLIELQGNTSVGGGLQLTGTTELIFLRFGKISGNVEIKGGVAAVVLREHEAVGGNLQIQHTSASASGELGLVVIADVTVGGNLQVANNSLTTSELNALQVQEASVAGNLQLSNNSVMGGFLNLIEVEVNRVGGSAELIHNTSGSLAVFHNIVANNLECAANKPPPRGSSNTAKQKLGQCELL